MTESISNLEFALHYASQLGWRVFPVKVDKTPLTPNGFQDATLDEKIIRAWWAKYPEAGIGIATGRESGIVVLDLDLKAWDAGLVDQVLEKPGVETVVVSNTGGGGMHIFFEYPTIGTEEKVANAVALNGWQGVDVRGDGGYVVVPPSAHASGNPYRWAESSGPFDHELPPCPPLLLTRKRSTKKVKIDVAAPIPPGERNVTLTSIAGNLRAMGMSAENILEELRRQNTLRCDPPLADEELRVIAYGVANYPPRPNHREFENEEDAGRVGAQTLLTFERSDAGTSEMIALVYGNRLRFNHNTKTWQLWRGHWWDPDQKGEVTQLMIDLTRLYFSALTVITDEDQRLKAQKYAITMQSAHRIQQALQLARTHPVFATLGSEWDNSPFLLGVKNGVVDLKTGKLTVGTPSDLISMHSPVAYDPGARAPRWEKFLDEVFDGDQEVMQFVQRAIGYSLTGETSEQCLFLLVGSGSNGKSVFLDVIRSLLGEYAFVAPFSTFERSGPAAASQSNDLAALARRRFVVASETSRGRTFDDARLKALTGSEPITARYLHQEFFTFIPVLKLWLGTNHLPQVRDDSDGFWRRVRLVEFNQQFTGPREDKSLKSFLLDQELPGILNWALRGCLDWQKFGLGTPEKVLKSTNQYRHDTDPMQDYYSECCIIGPGESSLIQDLFFRYTQWCTEIGLGGRETLSLGQFTARLARDYTREEEDYGRRISGISLKPVKGTAANVRITVSKKEGTGS